MAMHESHDEDVILELLDDGTLTDDQSFARLDNCETCVLAFTEQREMIRHLSELPRPLMDTNERADLRSRVDAALDAAVVTSIESRRRLDWTRVGTVAAALVGIVAVAGLYTSLGSGLQSEDAASSKEPVTAALEARAADEAAPTAQAEDSADGGSSDAAESGLASADTAAIAAPSNLVRDVGSVNEAMFESELEDIRVEVANLAESSGILQRQLDNVGADCVEAVPDAGTIRGILTATVNGRDVEVYLGDEGEEFGFVGASCSQYELP